MAENKLINIDLSDIIRARLGAGRGRFLPDFLLRPLEALICQDQLNDILRYAYPAMGSDFSHKCLEYLDIQVIIEGLDNLPDNEKFVFASNHPLGGLDGITLVGILGKRYGDENVKVLVNDMLMHVTPLAPLFLPINKYGAQGRKSAALINQAFEEGKQIVMFPAGLVSRLGKDGVIRDLEWQKSFVVKALDYHRRIVPVKFQALNSMKFYNWAKWRKKLGIKINIEQALLPSEIFKSRGATFKVIFGKPIDPTELKLKGSNPAVIASAIRKIVEKY